MLDFQLGPFLIQGSYIMILISLITAVIGLVSLLHTYRIPHKKTISNEWIQSILLVIVTWKFSYILVHPIEGIQDPLRLIYFDGGAVGWIVGSGIALLLYAKALAKSDISFTIAVNTFVFGGFLLFGAYNVLTTVFLSIYWQSIWFGIFYIAIAAFYFFSNRLMKLRSALRLGQWAVVGWIGHDMMNGNIHMNDWTLWGAFGLGVLLIVLDFRLDKGSEIHD